MGLILSKTLCNKTSFFPVGYSWYKELRNQEMQHGRRVDQELDDFNYS
jgi:hypothetical protein